MNVVRLDAIVFDAGTQVREAINEQVVSDYADRLSEGVEFPAVVLFHDGSQYYMADGFHRGMAHLRVGRHDIAADVRPGTREDALWFALGANKANGQRMTAGDKKHAILLALKTWNGTKSNRQIAEQVGCDHRYVDRLKDEMQVGTSPQLPDRVIGKDGKSYPASRPPTGPRPETVQKRQAIAALVRDGVTSLEIASRLHTSPLLVADVRREIGVGTPDRSPAAVAERRDRMRQMAADGYTSIQIADAVGLQLESCRNALRAEQIEVVGDKVAGRTRRIDSTRIVEHIVMDAEHLTADQNLIDFTALDAESVRGWVESLQESRNKLGAFIRRLQKETQSNEAA